jgi:hypothetical protein
MSFQEMKSERQAAASRFRLIPAHRDRRLCFFAAPVGSGQKPLPHGRGSRATCRQKPLPHSRGSRATCGEKNTPSRSRLEGCLRRKKHSLTVAARGMLAARLAVEEPGRAESRTDGRNWLLSGVCQAYNWRLRKHRNDCCCWQNRFPETSGGNSTFARELNPNCHRVNPRAGRFAETGNWVGSWNVLAGV